jgi:hypothetical protein
MRPARCATTFLAAAATVFAALVAAPPPSYGDNACKVSLSAGLNNTQVHDKKTKYTFGVSANSAESCADVVYVLVITEQLPDGTTRTAERTGEMRVRGQTRIEAVEYETESKNTVKGFEAKMKSCKVCDAP